MTNFRCYTYSEVEFGESCTVFIGKNGTGKSSILSAIRKGMSFAFSNDKRINPLRANNNANVRSFPLMDTYYNQFESGYQWPLSIRYQAEFNTKKIDWEFFKKGHPGSLHPTKYKKALDSIFEEVNQNEDSWPLFAFYGDSFPHLVYAGNEEIANKIIEGIIIPKDFAYHNWDSHSSFNPFWIKRLTSINDQLFSFETRLYNEALKNLNTFAFSDENQRKASYFLEIERLNEEEFKEINEKEIQHFKNELDFINSKFKIFSEAVDSEKPFINSELCITYLETKPVIESEYNIWFVFKSGERKTLEMLPMGYRRLFEMILDLSYRAYILTKGKYEPRGIVLIDEIELHLHPTLQQEVLTRFKKTFPEIQFIVTTHSPLVISNFKSNERNKIVKLIQDGNNYTNEVVENIYGIDYSIGLTEVMGAKYRASTIDSLIDSIVILASRNKIEDAEKMKKELYEIVGENNEFILNEIDARIEMNKK